MLVPVLSEDQFLILRCRFLAQKDLHSELLRDFAVRAFDHQDIFQTQGLRCIL